MCQVQTLPPRVLSMRMGCNLGQLLRLLGALLIVLGFGVARVRGLRIKGVLVLVSSDDASDGLGVCVWRRVIR